MRKAACAVLVLALMGLNLLVGDVDQAKAVSSGTPVWGFVWLEQASPPINQVHVPSSQYQSGSWRSNPATSNVRATVVRNGVGQYSVVFPFIGIPPVGDRVSSSGIALATAYAPSDRQQPSRAGSYCHAEMWWSTNGAVDEIVRVSCRDRFGNPADSQFTVMFTNGGDRIRPFDGTASAYLVYAWPGGSPPAEWVPISQYNHDGAPNHVNRLGVGMYRAHFKGESFTATGGHVQVNVIHNNEPNGPAANCVVTSWSPAGDGQDVYVKCTRGGQLAEGRFALIYTRNRSLMSNLAHAYAWSFTPSLGQFPAFGVYSANSLGGTNTLFHDGVGQYRVQFPRVARQPDHVQITPYGDPNRHCTVLGWSSPTSNWGDTTIPIECFDQGGRLADTSFDAAYVTNVPIVTPS